MRFKNRVDGGQQLAKALIQYKDNPDVVVVGLPRGGVVTAYEVAQVLSVPLDIIITRKIGAPMSPELAVGALTQSGALQFNEQLMRDLNINKEDVQPTIQQEREELQRRLHTYRAGRAPLDLKNKIAVLVDDGVATGATMIAAITSARELGAQKVVAATPVGAARALEKLKTHADEVIPLLEPESFPGISAFYDVFAQTEDDEVISLLQR